MIKIILILVIPALIWVLYDGYQETQDSIGLYSTLEQVGVPIESEVVEIKETQNENSQKRGTYYYTYTSIVNYTVLGQDYRLQFATASKNRDSVPQIGTKIPVLYNPQKPEEAIFAEGYAETEIESKTTILLALKFIIAILVIVFIIMVISLTRSFFS